MEYIVGNISSKSHCDVSGNMELGVKLAYLTPAQPSLVMIKMLFDLLKIYAKHWQVFEVVLVL